MSSDFEGGAAGSTRLTPGIDAILQGQLCHHSPGSTPHLDLALQEAVAKFCDLLSCQLI